MKNSLKSFTEKSKWHASKLGYSAGVMSDELVAEALRLHLEGRNDEAAALLGQVPPDQRSARTWRTLGHAELARGAHAAAHQYHETALQMNLDAGDIEAAVGDLVNLAAVDIDTGALDAAWEAAERAHDLVPNAWTPHVAKISVLNNRGDRGALARYLEILLCEHPEIKNNPDFRRHLENDLDFIGVEEVLTKETEK